MAQPQYPVSPTSSQVPGSLGPQAYAPSPTASSMPLPPGYQSPSAANQASQLPIRSRTESGISSTPLATGSQSQQFPTRSRSPTGLSSVPQDAASQRPVEDPYQQVPSMPPAKHSEDSPLLESSRTREKKESIEPEETVYAGILFLPAISRLKTGTEMDRHARLAFLLCILNAVLQMGVVRVINIYDYTEGLADDRTLIPIREVAANGDNFLTKAEKDSGENMRRYGHEVHTKAMMNPSNEMTELESARTTIPLCHRIGEGNGTFSCMPYSVKFVYEWSHLDTNGDGVWTATEAKADLSRLKDEYDISPETIFNNIINGLRTQASWLQINNKNLSLYLSQDVQQERAIPKAYFHFWQGDAMMCGFFDSNSCEAVAKAGVFESALKPGRLSPRSKGIYDLDSAIAYCYRMLEEGGVCEAALPTDFKRNREQRWERCGTRKLVEGGKYVNPYDTSQAVHVLEATYAAVSSYMRATSTMYIFFLSLIVMLWLWSLIEEVRDLIRFGEFLWVVPGIKPGEPSGEIIAANEDDVESYKIFGISTLHRAVLVVIYLIRVLVCYVLVSFGTNFLLIEEDYLDLVLNSLALTFILTIDSMLFALVENDITKDMENCKPFVYTTRLPTSGFLGYSFKKECWGLFLVPILSFLIVIRYTIRNKVPVLTVLMCACAQEGEKCLDSVSYQSDWWDNYWSRVLPAAIHHIDAMRVAGV